MQYPWLRLLAVVIVTEGMSDAALAGRSNSEDVRKEIFHELH